MSGTRPQESNLVIPRQSRNVAVRKWTTASLLISMTSITAGPRTISWNTIITRGFSTLRFLILLAQSHIPTTRDHRMVHGCIYQPSGTRFYSGSAHDCSSRLCLLPFISSTNNKFKELRELSILDVARHFPILQHRGKKSSAMVP